MPDEELEAALLGFLADELRVAPARVEPDTRIAEDLGVDGDDGRELMMAFGTRFKVDMSNFVIDRYFGAEAALNPFLLVYWRLRPGARPRTIPIRVADLIAAAQRGAW